MNKVSIKIGKDEFELKDELIGGEAPWWVKGLM